ncbi:MAG: signal peptidase II [Phycisphaerales bacterium]|nr:signal peptidase II [Phycisphaerales bacterium]
MEGETAPAGSTTTTSARDAAWRSPAACLLLLAVTVAALAIDLATKQWAFRTVAGEPVELRYAEVAHDTNYRLPFHTGVRALPYDLLDFRLVVNHGAVFGLGNGRRAVFIVFTIGAVLAGAFVFARWTRKGDWLTHVAIGLVLAGGLGNLYDRIVYGAVRDFFHMLPRWHLPFGLAWPGGNNEAFPWVFNVADVCLLAGMALLLIGVHRSERRLRHAPAPAAAGEASP